MRNLLNIRQNVDGLGIQDLLFNQALAECLRIAPAVGLFKTNSIMRWFQLTVFPATSLDLATSRISEQRSMSQKNYFA